MKPKGKPIKWNSNIAYVVGLITTDGNLSPDGRHLEITSNDIQLLETAKSCLQINNKITSKTSGYTSYTRGKSSYRIQFGNVVFYKWLLTIGLMPNKSKRIGTLKIPKKYFSDFLRGHLDGDGNISKYQDRVFQNSQRLYTRFYSASMIHLKWLRGCIKNLLNIKGSIQKWPKARICVLKYAKKESLKILPFIYPNKNVPCLHRKYKIIAPILNAAVAKRYTHSVQNAVKATS